MEEVYAICDPARRIIAGVMITRIRFGLLVGLAIVIASCAISIMYVFISGNPGGSDMQTLLVVQAAAIPVALLVVATDLALRFGENSNSFGNIWRATPAWVVLALLLFNLLVLIGELALFLRAHLIAREILWFEHVPLLCVVSCSLAVCALYARAFPATSDTPAGITRW